MIEQHRCLNDGDDARNVLWMDFVCFFKFGLFVQHTHKTLEFSYQGGNDDTLIRKLLTYASFVYSSLLDII